MAAFEAFDTFKAIGARSPDPFKMVPRHNFETFKDLALQGTTFKPTRGPPPRKTHIQTHLLFL